jgi:hypothetical protein
VSFPLNQSIESSNLPDFVQVPRFKPLRSLSSLPLGMDGRCERVDTWKVWPSLLVVCKVVQKAQYEYIKPILYIYILCSKSPIWHQSQKLGVFVGFCYQVASFRGWEFSPQSWVTWKAFSWPVPARRPGGQATDFDSGQVQCTDTLW